MLYYLNFGNMKKSIKQNNSQQILLILLGILVAVVAIKLVGLESINHVF